MNNEDHAMRALMGFSSFGRPRKRARHDHKSRTCTSTSVSTSQRSEVHHVVPGTMVEVNGDGRSASCLHVSSNAIVHLIHPPARHDQRDELSTIKSDGQAQKDATVWSLPATSMELLGCVENTKARFALLDSAAFARARRLANPFEALGRHRFINRSAMKMANLDFLFQWTQRQDRTEPFVFADVCGGPGGFSEYILWRIKEQAATTEMLTVVGFGITLKGAPWCDWKVNTETGDFHICDGADGTGDLYNIDNIHNFRDTLRRKYPAGAHLVVADGGFPDARDQSNQEILMIRLVFAETLTMFSVLRVGGSFVCKTFELSCPLMLQLFRLLNNCFEKITIVKPVTSRPASSERYIVAQTMLPDLPLDEIQRDLTRLVQSLETTDPLQESLTNVFPTSGGLDACLHFVALASDRHATQQIQACEQIIDMASDPESTNETLSDRRINRDEYYRVWNL